MKQFTSDQFTWKNGIGTAELSTLGKDIGHLSRFTIKSTRTNHTRTYELDTQSPGYEDGWDGEYRQYTDNLFDGTKVIIWNYWLATNPLSHHTCLMNNSSIPSPLINQALEAEDLCTLDELESFALKQKQEQAPTKEWDWEGVWAR